MHNEFFVFLHQFTHSYVLFSVIRVCLLVTLVWVRLKVLVELESYFCFFLLTAINLLF